MNEIIKTITVDVSTLTRPAAHFGFIPTGKTNIKLYAKNDDGIYKFEISKLLFELDAYAIIQDYFGGDCEIFYTSQCITEIGRQKTIELVRYFDFWRKERPLLFKERFPMIKE